jgi:hypothetical protein
VTIRAVLLALSGSLLLPACGSLEPAPHAARPPEPVTTTAGRPASSPPATTRTLDREATGSSAAPAPASSAATVAPATTAVSGATTVARTVATSAGPPYSAVAHRPAGLDQLPVRDVIAPVRVRVDGHGIDANVVPVSVAADTNELAVPPSPELVAWYEAGPAPDEAGNTVLAAHVDWDGRQGPFFTLDAVPVGAEVIVTLADGREVTYRVVSNARIAKVDLPRNEIFARAGAPQLVLITCGGDFDQHRRHYADNVVLFAEPV